MANRMFNRRNLLGLTQQALADEVNKINEEIEITQQHISNLERNVCKPSIRIGKAIAKVLKTRIDELF